MDVMKKVWKKILKITGVLLLFGTLIGCDSTSNIEEEIIFAPMIVYNGQKYESGYDDSNLLNKLPKGFKKAGTIKGVETDPAVSPKKEGYASEQAWQIRGVEKGTIIYANKKVEGYIMTEDNGKYVVYSSKDKNEVDYSDFLQGVQMQPTSKETMVQGYEEVQTSELTMKELAVYEERGNQVLLHNNGKEIKNDLFENEQTGGNILVGVSFIQTEGIVYETSYFAEKEMGDKELMAYIENAEEELLDIDNVAVRKGDIIKRFYWEFYSEEEKQITLASEFVLTQSSSHSSINETDGSIWNVQAGSTLKKVFASHIRAQEVGIYADYNSQYLLEYGQMKASEEDTNYDTEFLDDTIVPYPKEQSGFSAENQSNLPENYVKWRFKRRLTEDEKLNTNPALKVANTKGNLDLSFQYIMEIADDTSALFDSPLSYDTGKIKISVPDR